MRLTLCCLLTLCFVFARGQSDSSWYNMGCSAAINKEFEKAIECFTEAIKLNSENNAAYYHRGMANYELGNYKLAKADYSRAIRKNLRYGDIYYSRANAFFSLKDYDGAITDYQTALALDPNNQLYRDKLQEAIT